MDSNIESLALFLQTAEVTQQEDGLYTVHVEGVENPGKLYNISGNSEYEVLENAYSYIQDLKNFLR